MLIFGFDPTALVEWNAAIEQSDRVGLLPLFSAETPAKGQRFFGNHGVGGKKSAVDIQFNRMCHGNQPLQFGLNWLMSEPSKERVL